MNGIAKAYEMNEFAVSNGFSPSPRGCPRGFAVIEDCVRLNEFIYLCWCTNGFSARGNKYGKAAFVITSERLICAVKTGAGYEAQYVLAQSINRAESRRKRLFGKPEVVISTEDGDIRFFCTNIDEADRLAESIEKIIYTQIR